MRQCLLLMRSILRYEERSLGVFSPAPDDEDEEPDLSTAPTRGERLGRYLKWHLQYAWSLFGLECPVL